MNTTHKKITIAIDGFSSCGKSTLAKALAAELNYIYIDTGAMYRAVALFAHRQGWVTPNQINETDLVSNLDKIDIQFKQLADHPSPVIFLNNENVESEIRSLTISNLVSAIATLKPVREKLVAEQRKMGEKGGVVLDGRDIGSVVFPHAELKVFVTADPIIRAQRRYDELIQNDSTIKLEDIVDNIKNRDYTDTHRKESPLLQTDDAIVLDNTKLTKKQQLMWILNEVCEILKH